MDFDTDESGFNNGYGEGHIAIVGGLKEILTFCLGHNPDHITALKFIYFDAYFQTG
jgi:hypothetical protein